MEPSQPADPRSLPVGEVRVESIVGWLAGASLLGAAAIHGVFIAPHLQEHVSHGIFFTVVTVAQVLLAVAVVRRRGGRALGVAALASVGVIGVWVASRTVGIGGVVEPVGLADAVSSALEAVVALGFVACALPSLAHRRVAPAPAGAALGATAVVMLGLVVPSVVVGPSQHHHLHDHQATTARASSHDMASHNKTGHVAGSAVPVGSSAAPMAHNHAKVPCPNPTLAQQQAADRLIQDTKQGTARLANVETAKAEGYMRFGDADIAGTWHYINWKYQADSAVLDPAHPESIIYWQASPTSPLFLIGVMYITPRAGMAGPQVAGCLTQWHSHGAPFAPEGVSTPEMLHVWFVPLPGGPFVTDPSHPEE